MRSQADSRRIDAVLKRLPPLRARARPTTRDGVPAFAATPFVKLMTFNRGGVFVGRFTGQTPWERHRRDDEMVQVLEGEVELTVMRASGPVRVTLTAGSVFVVPRGLWHRQRTRTEVALLTATPTPTDISFADDPRAKRRLGS